MEVDKGYEVKYIPSRKPKIFKGKVIADCGDYYLMQLKNYKTCVNKSDLLSGKYKAELIQEENTIDLKQQILLDNGFVLNYEDNIYINKKLQYGFNLNILKEIGVTSIIKVIKDAKLKTQ